MEFFSFAVSDWIIAAVVLLVAYYVYLTRRWGFMESQGLKGPKPLPFFGNIHHHFLQASFWYEYECYQKYGRTFCMYEGRNPLIYTGDPELIKNTFVKDFHKFPIRRDISTSTPNPIARKMLLDLRGEEWRTVRTTVTPAFSSGKIRQMLELIQQSVEVLVDNMRRESREGFVDMKKNFECFTIDVIASCAFGTDLSSQKTPNHPFVKNAQDAFASLKRLTLVILFPVLLIKMLKIDSACNKPIAYFKKSICNLMDLRAAQGTGKRSDFLRLMMEAKSDEEKEMVENPSKKPVLTLDTIVAQSILFFLAGYDTTSITLTFTAYELSFRPDIQEKLHEEIETVLNNNKGQITFDALHEMKYLEMVVLEALRMYPPIPRTLRTAVEDVRYGNLFIPKNTAVAVPIFAMQRDPEFYPDPHTFNPDRFNPENKQARNPHTFMPFGIGPRNCIGTRFAMMEAKAALVRVIQDFRLEPCEKTEKPLKYAKGFGFLRTENNIVLKMTPREKITRPGLR